MSNASNTPKNLKGILGINNKPLVSKDFNHNPHSSIFDVTQTQVIKNKFSRVLSWYDNEWGFSNRMCETSIQIARINLSFQLQVVDLYFLPYKVFFLCS